MEQTYTAKEGQLVVYDPDGNIVNFSDLLSRKTSIDEASAKLAAEVAAIWAQVSVAVPQEVIEAFGLTPQ